MILSHRSLTVEGGIRSIERCVRAKKERSDDFSSLLKDSWQRAIFPEGDPSSIVAADAFHAHVRW
ncbi:MAG TPA: hypothetical protein DD435_08780 [Cyanobacteria bacterium UBA8530]|nr:hypothetical protein [Cyanobacteria bacterium UBA8530]